MINPEKLVRVARVTCYASAAGGAVATVVFDANFAPAVCCTAVFWYITLRFVADFCLVPLVCAASLTAIHPVGRTIFWISSVYLGLFVWTPYITPLAALCMWAHVSWLPVALSVPDGVVVGRIRSPGMRPRQPPKRR